MVTDVDARSAASGTTQRLGESGGQLVPLLGAKELQLAVRFQRRQRVELELVVFGGHLKREVVRDHQHVHRQPGL